MALHAKDDFFYHGLDASGKLTISPHDQQLAAVYAAGLETPHQPPWLALPWILNSHGMSVQIPLSLRNTLSSRRQARQETGPTGRFAPMDADLSKLGLRAAPFAVNPDPDAREAMLILQALLQRSADFCATNSIQLRVVTVPFFPQNFYTTQQGTNWSMRFGDHDFLKPEREITAWAKAHNLPVLPLGEWMQQQKLDVPAIRALYFTGGSGHFTEAGHRFIADAMAENFYPGVK